MSKDPCLDQALVKGLEQIEADGDIVICTASPRQIVERLSETVLDVMPNTGLTQAELAGLRALVLLAASRTDLFDWEIRSLTGLTAQDFLALADKLPRQP